MRSVIQKRVLGAACLAASLALLFTVSANEALAQVRPAYTKNVDEGGRLPYVHTVSVPPSPYKSTDVFFPAIPSGKRLVVEHISAAVFSTPVAGEVSLVLGGAYTSYATLYLSSFTAKPGGLVGTFWDRPIRFFWEASAPLFNVRIMSDTVPFDSFDNVRVTVVGYLIDATN